MNKRIKKKKHKQYLLDIAKRVGVKTVGQREIHRKQLLTVQNTYYEFCQWLDQNRPTK